MFFFAKCRTAYEWFCSNVRCAKLAFNGDAGRTFQFFSARAKNLQCFICCEVIAPARITPCRLTAQDPGPSSRGMRVRIPSRRPFCSNKRRFLIRDRSAQSLSDFRRASRRPKPAGDNFKCACSVTATCRSASPESRVRFSAHAPFMRRYP